MIPKPGGGERPLGTPSRENEPSGLDRVRQAAKEESANA
jgi:hypothetical protein